VEADLVTLNACETALEKVESGDDVVGFTRGFLYAGTNSIVSSIWSTDERANYELMKKFTRTLTGCQNEMPYAGRNGPPRRNIPTLLIGLPLNSRETAGDSSSDPWFIRNRLSL
jgi:hypothetical protein